jgi:transposase-like protein
MGRAAKWPPEQKLPPVLSILRGEGSVVEIGRRHQVSNVTLAKWRDAGGAEVLANGSRREQSSREADL